ncbi:MAG: type II secretion system protein [Pseudomonadales bacterium]
MATGAPRGGHGGFTLVELITVMMILGILAIGTVRFIGDSSQGFASTVARTELASDARAGIDRLVRDVRNALPNSVRVSGSCLELIPVAGASRYLNLPVTSASSSFNSVPLDPLPLPAGARVAVYPNSGVYVLAGSGVVSPPITASAPGAGNVVQIAFAAPHSFPAHSPTRRYFVVTEPVSYCVAGDALYRYSGYGFAGTQPGIADLPAALPGRAMIAQQVTGAVPFRVSGATLNRNAVVQMDLRFERGGDAVRFEHSVQVRNVP